MTKREQKELNKKLLEAVSDGEEVGVIRDLLEAGADVHIKDEDGATLLHIAAKQGRRSRHGRRCSVSCELLPLLLEFGMQEEINALDERGRTPLFYALNCYESALMLIEAGANVHTQDDAGATLLHAAARIWYGSAVMRLLLRQGMQEELKALDEREYTPLHIAISEENFDAVRLLVEAGADIHLNNGYTMLHWATQIRNDEILRYLLRQGMREELNALDEQGNPPLFYASNKIEKVRLLIEAGADMHLRDEDGNTLLHDVEGNCEVMRLLLSLGMQEEIMSPNDQGDTPLHVALRHKQNECARILLESGVDIHAEDEDQRTWLHFAAVSRNAEMLEYLLENGLKDKVNARDCVGATPLHYACRRSKSSECVRILLKAGADVHAKLQGDCKRPGQTPLHVAVDFRPEHDYETVRLLIEAGADVNTAADDGRTLLMDAVGRAKDESDKWSGILHLLLEAGADVHAADKEGKTALDYVEAPLYPYALLQKWAEKK